MTKEKQSLELDQDLPFQKKWWKREKIAWWIMILIVIAALSGLTGNGILSRGIAGNKTDKIWIEFHRFLRNKSGSIIHVHINEQENNNKIELLINRDYAKNIRIEQVIPESEEVETSTDYIVYKFKTTEEKSPQLITFYIKPEGYGKHKAVFKLKDGTFIDFTQFIYP